jgi:hypothetical protein
VPRPDIPQSHKEEAVIKQQREEPAAPTVAVLEVPEAAAVVPEAVEEVPEAVAAVLEPLGAEAPPNRISHKGGDIMEATA